MTTGNIDKVLVYGTLLSGMRNHDLLNGAEFVANYEVSGFLMIDLGSFPACISIDDLSKTWGLLSSLTEGDFCIQAELYKINGAILDRLDMLEGYPNLYDRIIIETEDGPAYMYIFHELMGKYRIVPGGDWKTYFKEKNARRTK